MNPSSPLIALIAAAMLPATPSLAQDLGTSFFDDFDRLSLARWYVSDGWSNGDYVNCGWTSDQIALSGGVMRVGYEAGAASGKSYRCGEIRTNALFQYGTFEARLKTPSGSGLNAAFFTYTGPIDSQPHDEIDFEVLLKDTATVSTATFVNGQNVTSEIDLPYPASDDFVTLAVTWAPDRIDFYVNGALLRSVTDPAEIPTHPQRLFFSIWGTEMLNDWMGPFVPPPGPIAMEVDWVGYTALGESCAFEQSILCEGAGI